MNIDLGYLGRVILEEVETPVMPVFTSFTVVLDGYTESGIRVHGVLDQRESAIYPCVWQNAILIKVS